MDEREATQSDPRILTEPQSRTLWTGVGVILLMGFLPPWIMPGGSVVYWPVFLSLGGGARIDVARLLIQWTCTAAVTVAWIVAGPPKWAIRLGYYWSWKRRAWFVSGAMVLVLLASLFVFLLFGLLETWDSDVLFGGLIMAGVMSWFAYVCFKRALRS